MPKRTNPFQQLIAMLVQLLKDSVVVEESKEFPDPDTGRPREVDVYALIRGKWDEEEITVAVECVDRKRKMDVTWVEMIYGKHSILQVGDVVLLVSRSGFWHSAEVKAKRFGYRTITPAISPKRLATEIGLAGDFRLSARAMTLRFGATTVDVNVPTHSHHWASGEHFQRSDGSELVEVQEFEVEVLKDELSKDESFHSDKRASEFTRRVTVDEPMFNGERLYATSDLT